MLLLEEPNPGNACPPGARTLTRQRSKWGSWNPEGAPQDAFRDPHSNTATFTVTRLMFCLFGVEGAKPGPREGPDARAQVAAVTPKSAPGPPTFRASCPKTRSQSRARHRWPHTSPRAVLSLSWEPGTPASPWPRSRGAWGRAPVALFRVTRSPSRPCPGERGPGSIPMCGLTSRCHLWLCDPL